MFKKECCEKLAPCALTLLRVVVGIIMAAHGWQKASDIAAWTSNLTQMGIPLPEINAYLSIAGELLGGLGLLFGLITPVAAFGIASTMVVAICQVHLANGLFAKDGGFEYPLTLLSVAIFFIFNGAGPYSLDAKLSQKFGCCKKTEG